jgi:hypothetical protein
VGYLVAWEIEKVLQFQHAAYIETATDIVVEKSDTTVDQMTENKIDKLYWESQRSWHMGAGQRRFSDPKTSDQSAYLLSQGVDVRVPGQATLLPDITNQHSSAGAWTNPSTAAAPRLAVAADIVFQEDYTATGGQNDSFRGVTLPTTDGGSPTLKIVRAGSASTNGVTDVCSDGQNLFWSIGDDATPKITTLAGTAADGSVGSVYASGTFGTGAQPSDARVIAWVKNQLVAAGIQSAGSGSASQVWRLFAVGAGSGTSKELILLPAGWKVNRNCITEIAGFILFGATSGHQSAVYAWDGQTTPYICASLPDGDEITSMSNYLGVEVLIGCRRVKSTVAGTPVGTGVLYVGQAAAAGQLILKEIVEIADAGVPWPVANTKDAFDYAVACIANRGRYSYFTWQPFGVGVYDHLNQSYSRYLGNLSANAGSLLNGGAPPTVYASVGDIVVCLRRLCFSAQNPVSTYKLWVEDIGVLVSSGVILGSIMDWNVDKPKAINQAEVGSLPLPAGTSIALAQSTDGGSTLSTIGTLSGTGATVFTSSATSSPPANFSTTANTINYQVTLNSEATTHLLTPILKKAGFGAWYGSKPTIEWTIFLRAEDRMTAKNGAPYILQGGSSGTTYVAGPDPQLPDKIAQRFRDLRASQAIIDWQPPGWGDTRSDSYKVQVRGYKYYRWNLPGVGAGGGAVQLEIKQAP